MFYRMSRQKFPLSRINTICLAASFLIFSGTMSAQQSSAEAVSSLRSRFDKDRSGLDEILRCMPDTPAILSDGSFASTMSNLQSELDTLSKQLEGARSMIEGKMKSLQSNQGLSGTDKSTLLGELNRQLVPVNELKSSISSLRSKVDLMIAEDIPKWEQSYKSYSDIMGEDAAKENLRKSVKEFALSLGKQAATTSVQKR